MASEDNPVIDFSEGILSHLALTCAVISLAIITIAWYIRDSLKVDNIHQRHVFITGCDSGFGNLLARQLDRQGLNVIAACLTQEGASALTSATSSRLKTLLLNVTDSASIRRAVDFVSAEVGERGLWGLVNNAGKATPFGPAEWMHLEDYTALLDVNLIGLVDVTLQFLPLLKKSQGRVVNVASVMGRLSISGGGYCLSKFGVEAFSDSLRRDMIHFGIKVSIIEPGFFKTAVTSLDLIEPALKKLWKQLPQETRQSYGSAYLDKYLKSQAFYMRVLCSPDIGKVTRCMQHALTARHPRTRYGAGWDAKLVWIPISYLPSFVTDFIISALLPVPKADREVCPN